MHTVFAFNTHFYSLNRLPESNLTSIHKSDLIFIKKYRHLRRETGIRKIIGKNKKFISYILRAHANSAVDVQTFANKMNEI